VTKAFTLQKNEKKVSKTEQNQYGFSKSNANRTKGSIISNEMEKIEGVITELAAS